MDNQIFNTLINLVGFFNNPQNDKKLLNSANVKLEAPAFPIFSAIARKQPISVSEIANIVGKNYSSVSRQIDKLENSNLVTSSPSLKDSRVRISTLTEEGNKLNKQISDARTSIIKEALSDWSDEEKQVLLHSLDHLTNELDKFK
ncbi:MarR family winged helix-turn-helix transcriptional regulator [Lactobacillus terrae]|uniref:MarR family winged helix-turn-helix transcriptional regulator n=1 Tax=Lactobacillus terrae TaxID=2269374 RepID=UPI0015CF84FA|nr:MarR family transcriptional regulator [Lactobacillus terrae]